ncbi:MAG: hypothetical protein ACKV1O_16950, partial [Saprospiraceae bacterium]
MNRNLLLRNIAIISSRFRRGNFSNGQGARRERSQSYVTDEATKSGGKRKFGVAKSHRPNREVIIAAFLSLCALIALIGCQPEPVTYDLLIRNALIYDGSGKPPVQGAIAVNADTIAAIGELPNAKGKSELDAGGMAVSPGFINMLSWATESLIADGRGMSDLKQGVTLEVMGEGWSMGPLNDQMKAGTKASQGDI